MLSFKHMFTIACTEIQCQARLTTHNSNNLSTTIAPFHFHCMQLTTIYS